MRSILDAPGGAQRDTLNGQAFGIGQLVAGGEIPAELALDELRWAADLVPSLDPRRPWRPGECRRIVERAFRDGQTAPRVARRG